MARVTFENGFERCDYFLCAGGGLAIRGPEFPGIEVHHRLGAQGLHIEISRKLRGHGFHRLRVRGQNRRRIAWVERLSIRIAFRQRADQGPVGGRGVCGEALRLGKRIERDLGARWRHDRQVVVGAHGECHAPVTGGAVRIELRGARKRARRFIVIERP